jgi:hypothetical protein
VSSPRRVELKDMLGGKELKDAEREYDTIQYGV